MLPPIDYKMARYLERNARLVVAVRRLAAALHRREGHFARQWTECENAACRAAGAAIERNDLPEERDV